MCEYSCKNVNGMRKHMTMKHGDHKCKLCNETFTNSMDVLAHKANCHNQELIEVNLKIIVPLKKSNENPCLWICAVRPSKSTC